MIKSCWWTGDTQKMRRKNINFHRFNEVVRLLINKFEHPFRLNESNKMFWYKKCRQSLPPDWLITMSFWLVTISLSSILLNETFCFLSNLIFANIKNRTLNTTSIKDRIIMCVDFRWAKGTMKNHTCGCHTYEYSIF